MFDNVNDAKRLLFPNTVVREYERDGEKKQHEYPALRVGDDLFIVMERDNSNAHQDDPYYGTNIDLHVMTGDMTWAGGGCTVYGPELTFGFEVKHAHVNVSTCSEKSLERTLAHAKMIEMAAVLAESWTHGELPALEQAAREEEAKAKQQREEMRVKREAELIEAKRVADLVDGKQVRITVKGKKVPYVGYIAELDGLRFGVNIHWKEEDLPIHFNDIVKMESKNDRGRFETAYVVEEA